MKKIHILLTIILLLMLSGCASEEDKAIAQSVMDKIDSIEVTLDTAEDIYDIHNEYQELTNKQKRLIKNSKQLEEDVAALEELITAEEIKNDPSNKITKADMVGIWEADSSSDGRTNYYYFTKGGYVYYMASKITPTQSSFTGEYMMATQYNLDSFNENLRAKVGGFYSPVLRRDFNFTVKVTDSGDLEMKITDASGKETGAGNGTYYKTNQVIDTTPKLCLHSGCTNTAVTTGDSVYCLIHSNNCMICGKYIDEDALLCLNCIAEALRTN